MSKSTNFGSILQLRSYSADPATTKNGMMYYNTTDNKVRVYQNGSWGDVAVGSVSLTGQVLNEYNVIVGNSTSQSASVDTSASGHISASSTTGLTVKNNIITNAMISGSANIDRTKLASGTADRVVVNNGSGVMTDSTVTTTELGYLSGATSNIQTQLDAKLESADLTNYLKKDGSVEMTGALIPTTPNNIELGSSAKPFSYVHSNRFSVQYGGSGSAAGALQEYTGGIVLGAQHSTLGHVHLMTGGVSTGTKVKISDSNLNSVILTGVKTPVAADDASNKDYVDTKSAEYLPLVGGSMTGNIVMAGNRVTGLGAPVNPNDAARKIDLENALSGLDFQKDVDDVQVDNTLVPVATLGKRYIITDAGNLNAGFGTIAGVANGDIVEYDGANFFVAYDVSVQGSGALAWSKQDTSFYRYDGTSWTEFGGLSALNAGVGLIKTGNTIDVNLGAGISQLPSDEVGVDIHASAGLMLTEDGTAESTNSNAQLSVKLDGSTLSKNSSGLKVAAGGITNTEISVSASISLAKLEALTGSKALVTDASGYISESTVLAAEIGHLSGVVNPIQGQLDDKANRTLSNLTSTSIGVHLMPATQATRNIGNTGSAFSKVHAQRFSGVDSTKSLVVSSSAGAVLTFADASTVVAGSSYIVHSLFDGVGGIVKVISKSGNDVTVSNAPSSNFSGETVQVTFSVALRTEDETTAGLHSGPIFIRSGNVTGNGDSGDLLIKSGDSVSGGTGNILIQSGDTGAGADFKGKVEVQGREITLQTYDGVLIQNASGGTVILAPSSHTLAANTSTFTAIPDASFNRADSKSAHIQYEVVQSNTDEVRTGTLMLAISASNVGVSDVYAVSGGNLDTVIDFDATVDGFGEVEILFKNTDASNACTFKVLTSNIATF